MLSSSWSLIRTNERLLKCALGLLGFHFHDFLWWFRRGNLCFVTENDRILQRHINLQP